MLTTREQTLLEKNAREHLARTRHVIEKTDDRHVVINGKKCLNFCSNDYLGIARHPDVINAFIDGAIEHGLGSGSSPLISGYTYAHQQLEDAFAEFLQRDKTLLFNSGYHANLGVLTTFADKNTYIVSDKLCHASLIDGIRLSRANHLRYRHCDMTHAELLLQQIPIENAILVSESVFSMEGDLPDMTVLSRLAKKYRARLIVDDAHGIGVCDHKQFSQNDVPCLVVPMGKALGSCGAVVAGSNDLIDVLLQFARTYRYSTALPPAVCHATVTSLNVLRNEIWRREKLHDNIKFFLRIAHEHGLRCTSTELTPIKSIIVGENQATLQIQHDLQAHGIFISCIRPPTVPANTARVRISLNWAHTESDIHTLLEQLAIAIMRTNTCNQE